MKEQEKFSEKEVNETEANNLLDPSLRKNGCKDAQGI